MHQDNYTLAFLKANIWPAIDGLDKPPGPDEGFIAEVEMDRVRATATESDCKASQFVTLLSRQAASGEGGARKG